VTSTADVLYSLLAKDGSVREALALWKWWGNLAGRSLVFATGTLLLWPAPQPAILREVLHKQQVLQNAFAFFEIKIIRSVVVVMIAVEMWKAW
jgi:hypothetical protein